MMAERDGRPLLLIDIAVPRDIEPSCAELEGVTLYDIDDLQAVVARNLSSRARGGAARAARSSRRRSGASPPGSASSTRCRRSAPCASTATRSSRASWRRTPAAGSRPPPRDVARVEAIARAVMSRLLHEPTIRLRSGSGEHGHSSLEFVRELFGLQDEPVGDGSRSRRSSPRSTTCASAGPGPRAGRQPMRIGTRGSELALAQATRVAGMIGGCEVVTITTSGDRGAGVGDKSRWVAELEDALSGGEIDLAVHSAKDLPGELAPGLELLGAPARAATRTSCAARATSTSSSRGARVGTSSISRVAQLRAAREDLEVVPVRGNVDTRLRQARRPRAGSATRSCSRTRACSGSGIAVAASAACSTRGGSSRPRARA